MPLSRPETAAASGPPGDGAAEAQQPEDPLSDEFVEELTKNMESFMAQLGQRMSTAQDVPPPPADHPVSGAGEPRAAPRAVCRQLRTN